MILGLPAPPHGFNALSGGIHRVVYAAINLGVPEGVMQYGGLDAFGAHRLLVDGRRWTLYPDMIGDHEKAVTAAKLIAEPWRGSVPAWKEGE